MTKMTLEQVRDKLRRIAAMMDETDGGSYTDMCNAIDAHLAKGAQVPDEHNAAHYECTDSLCIDEPCESAWHRDAYSLGHMDGWNACREAMLSQRGEVEGG